MEGLISLDACLARALIGTSPVAPESLPLAEATGHALARDLCLVIDEPRAAVALRAGIAVSSLDLVGASSHTPVPLTAAQRVVPGMDLPPGADAVLPEVGAEMAGGNVVALASVSPGEGMRRPGHDGRAGDVLAPAGVVLRPNHVLAATCAGIDRAWVRRPRVRIDLAGSAQARFAAAWIARLGGMVTDDVPDLDLRSTSGPAPRLALAPGEDAWIEAGEGPLVLFLPTRFDGMLASLVALALPALHALGGAAQRTVSLPVASKVPSAVGLSEVVLLTDAGDHWFAGPAGVVTLTGLARADAIAVIPPDSEGMPAGDTLAAVRLSDPVL